MSGATFISDDLVTGEILFHRHGLDQLLVSLFLASEASLRKDRPGGLLTGGSA